MNFQEFELSNPAVVMVNMGSGFGLKSQILSRRVFSSFLDASTTDKIGYQLELLKDGEQYCITLIDALDFASYSRVLLGTTQGRMHWQKRSISIKILQGKVGNASSHISTQG